jgi:capsular exopolysaccharide synthesis family protein
LVGADLRKPKVYLDIDIRDKVGLSNFLSGKSTIDQIIINTGVKNLDFIPAGSVPPNPAELLNGDRIATFFEEVKSRYDYIIVDTPPIGLVTDALPLTKYANLVVYMVRHNYTQTKYLKELADLFKTGVFPSFVYLFNDFEITKNFGYGYRYGYYKNDKEKSGYYTVDDESKSFLRKLFKV